MDDNPHQFKPHTRPRMDIPAELVSELRRLAAAGPPPTTRAITPHPELMDRIWGPQGRLRSYSTGPYIGREGGHRARSMSTWATTSETAALVVERPGFGVFGWLARLFRR